MWGPKKKLGTNGIKNQQNKTFNFELIVEKMEKTIGVGISDDYKGGVTLISTVDGNKIGIQMLNAIERINVGDHIEIQAKIFEYKQATQRFEFIQIE